MTTRGPYRAILLATALAAGLWLQRAAPAPASEARWRSNAGPGITIPLPDAPAAQGQPPDETSVETSRPNAAPPLSAAEAIAAAEDHDFDRVTPWIARALAQDPVSFGPRALRLYLAMAEDPDDFVAGRPVLIGQPGDTREQERLEACWHATFALYLARDSYRGDGDEDSRAFIDRVTREANGVLDRLQGLDNRAEHLPWKIFLENLLHHYLHAPTDWDLDETQRKAFEALGPWGLWLRLLAIDHQAVSGKTAIAWLDDHDGASRALPSPLAPRVLLARLRVDAAATRDSAVPALYAEHAATFPVGRYRDDFELAWGQALAKIRTESARRAAVEHLRPLVQGRRRNTTYEATKTLGKVLHKLGRYFEALDLYETFRKRYPSYPDQLLTPTGDAWTALEQYVRAVDAYRRAIEGPRGGALNYLDLAMCLPYLPDIDPETYDRQTVRAEALKLSDFGVDAFVRELRVLAWTHDTTIDWELTLAKPLGLMFHATLFPLTFLSMGLMLLTELLAVALGLVAFVSYPRLAQRTWLGIALLAAALLVPTLPTLIRGVTSSGTLAVRVTWFLQSGARLYFVLAGAVLLGPTVRTQALATIRGWRRSRRRGDTGRWLRRTWPLGASIGVLALVSGIAAHMGRVPSPYLDRFPALLSIAELGAVPPDAGDPFHLSLGLFSVIRMEILFRGLILTLLAYLFRARRWGRPAAIVASALFSTLLVCGTMEPTAIHAMVALIQGLLLGTIRFRHGVDGALFVRLSAFLISGGNP